MLGKVHGRFRVFLHSLIRQKTRPGTLFYGKRGEYCCYKYRVFSISTKKSNCVFDFAIKQAIPRRNVTTLSSGFDRDNYPNMPICYPSRNGQYRCVKPIIFNDYRYLVTTVQPSGIPLLLLTSQVASLLLTNVPVWETPESQL